MRHLYAADLPTREHLAARRANAKEKRPDYIIIAGGGKVGYQVGRALIEKGAEVLILDKRPSRYQMLHDELGQAVFFGDACEIRTMARVGMERADLGVASNQSQGKETPPAPGMLAHCLHPRKEVGGDHGRDDSACQ